MNFVFRISTNDTDLAGDQIDQNGINLAKFARNPVVLAAHESQAFPIASSSLPWTVGGSSTLARVDFPAPGISAASDEARALVGAGVLRGCSIGFIPEKFSPANDPDRPFGLNFHTITLLEFSLASIPCNSGCLLVGAADAATRSAPAHSAPARSGRAPSRVERVLETARLLASVKRY
jgi:hypothetical protein